MDLPHWRPFGLEKELELTKSNVTKLIDANAKLVQSLGDKDAKIKVLQEEAGTKETDIEELKTKLADALQKLEGMQRVDKGSKRKRATIENGGNKKTPIEAIEHQKDKEKGDIAGQQKGKDKAEEEHENRNVAAKVRNRTTSEKWYMRWQSTYLDGILSKIQLPYDRSKVVEEEDRNAIKQGIDEALDKGGFPLSEFTKERLHFVLDECIGKTFLQLILEIVVALEKDPRHCRVCNKSEDDRIREEKARIETK